MNSRGQNAALMKSSPAYDIRGSRTLGECSFMQARTIRALPHRFQCDGQVVCSGSNPTNKLVTNLCDYADFVQSGQQPRKFQLIPSSGAISVQPSSMAFVYVSGPSLSHPVQIRLKGFVSKALCNSFRSASWYSPSRRRVPSLRSWSAISASSRSAYSSWQMVLESRPTRTA